jgi:hypothetical protein
LEITVVREPEIYILSGQLAGFTLKIFKENRPVDILDAAFTRYVQDGDNGILFCLGTKKVRIVHANQ